MPLIRRLRSAVMVTALAAAAVLAIAAVPSAPAAPAAGPGRLAVGVEVLHFAGAGRSITATGQVTATLTDNSGRKQTVRTTVALSAKAGGGCRVLHLDLKELTLSLLGLHAHLDRVVLDITGNSQGGVLGSLFCKLARAKVASASRASAARALNSGLRHNRNHALRFTAYLNPAVTTSTAAGTTCPVLDLVVGPLNLQLLGLVVNLNRVHLAVTATRGEGILGDTFCKLADNTTTTTTATTTSSAAPAT